MHLRIKGYILLSCLFICISLPAQKELTLTEPKTGLQIIVINKDYPLLPDAREFILVLPVIGNHKNEIRAYIKNNKECFGRAVVNGLPVSNNFYHLHQLQNLFFALTNEEINVKI